MNEMIRQLYDRRSCRVFDPRPVEENVKREILAAAIQAPSAGNMALYTIVDITDPELKGKLSVSCDNQPFIATAPMVLVFCADYRRWYDVFCAHVEPVRHPGLGDLMLAQADTLIAAQNAVVAAQSLGLGSCYIGDITEHYEYHRELLGLPQYVAPTAMLVLGYPTEQQLGRPKPPRHAVEDLVHENGYSLEKAARMEAMLSSQQGKEGQALADYITRFCKRKYNSAFSEEMTRSCEAMVKDWYR